MLSLTKQDRVRMLSAVAKRGPVFTLLRVVVITISLVILLAVPLTGLVRIDLWQGNHLLLGESVDFFTALKGFIVAMAIMYGGTFVSNMIVGRFFCGWGCPVGYVARFGEDVANSANMSHRLLMHLKGASFVATFVGAVMLWWVDPRVLIDGSLVAKSVTTAIFAVLVFGGLGHAFIWRFGFCLKVCPIGLYYQIVTSKAPIGIVFNEVPNPCIECGACEKICPVKIDPKSLGVELESESTSVDEEPLRYGDAECIRCGDCIEACKMIFKSEPGKIPPLRFGNVAGQKVSVERSTENVLGPDTELATSDAGETTNRPRKGQNEMNKLSTLILGLICLSLVACGGGDDTTTNKSSKSSSKTQTKTTTKKEADPSAMGPLGGTLDLANSGTVVGKVKFGGTAPKATQYDVSRDKWCGENAKVMSETIVVSNDGGLRDVFVYLEGLDDHGQDFPAPDKPARIIQKGCQYRPHVFGVMVGQEVEVVNADETSHNYHFTGAANDEINKTQPKPGTNIEVFEAAELSAQLRCDIHPWMSARVHIMEHPCFAVSATDGSFTISNVPPGKYKLRLIHENAKAGRDSIDVTIGPKGSANVGEITFN